VRIKTAACCPGFAEGTLFPDLENSRGIRFGKRHIENAVLAMPLETVRRARRVNAFALGFFAFPGWQRDGTVFFLTAETPDGEVMVRAAIEAERNPAIS